MIPRGVMVLKRPMMSALTRVRRPDMMKAIDRAAVSAHCARMTRIRKRPCEKRNGETNHCGTKNNPGGTLPSTRMTAGSSLQMQRDDCVNFPESKKEIQKERTYELQRSLTLCTMMAINRTVPKARRKERTNNEQNS